MNFEEIHKKFYQSDDEDSESLASSTSDISFTKKEVKVETSVISNKSEDNDSIQELIKSIERTDSLKLDESLKDKVNEIIESLQETDSSSSGPKLDESLNESEKTEDKSEADLKKVADNLENSQLNESVAESEHDSDLKQVAQNLEAALNDSLNDSSIEENKEASLDQSLNEPSEPEAKNLISLSSSIIKASDNLTEIVGEIISKTEPETEEPPSALAQIMQLVTGMTRLSDEEIESEPKEELHDDTKEEWQYVDSKANQYDVSFEDLNTSTEPASDSKQEANETKESEDLNASIEEPEIAISQTLKELTLAPSELKEESKVESQHVSSEPPKEEHVSAEPPKEQEHVSSEPPKEQEKVFSEPPKEQEKVSSEPPKEQEHISEQDVKDAEVEVPDAIERISETLFKLTQNLFEPEPEPEENSDLVLVSEERTDSEIRLTYVDADGHKHEAVGCTFFRPDDVLFRKEEILNKYKLNEEQFDLCRDFFNEKREEGSLLNNKLLRTLMKEAVKTRTQVKASEEDVDRALEAVDENKDDKITFDEFIQLLLLFFSSKNNVENRVGNVLQAKLSSETLSANEALEFANFLNKFYGRQENSDEFKDGLNVADFLKNFLPSLGALAFVQQEEEKAESAEHQKAEN